ncbi:protein ULTRAPETALA 1-like [Lotus japonicus]|uniref:protein ULTRAPETALA 1-like n=1 Tax=Lotus japonicus TaxID=34305 RepID=UPI00258D8B0D|nr:protein ULTRAPETALA 1-like [Lotus japonicus]
MTQENLTPEEFEKHAGKEGGGKWKNNIWVHEEKEDRVPISKTPLLQYYTHQANVSNWIDSVNRKRNFHRDEFIRCSSCNKRRRFRLNCRDEIRIYHAAMNNKMWSCSDWPYQKITCDHEEERSSVRSCRVCPRYSLCQGCSSCYCGGCIKCRFEDCDCQECRDFMLFAEP